MCAPVLRLVGAVPLIVGIASCTGPSAPDGAWDLTSAVAIDADSVRVVVTVRNASATPRVPPIYNLPCGADLRVYSTGADSSLLFDGLSIHGCIDVGYSTVVGSGGEEVVSATLPVSVLADAGLLYGQLYQFRPVLRSFDGDEAVEVGPFVELGLPIP